MAVIVLRMTEPSFLDHDAAILAWLSENAPGRAQAFTASQEGKPALIAFLEDREAVAFKLCWGDRVTFAWAAGHSRKVF